MLSGGRAARLPKTALALALALLPLAVRAQDPLDQVAADQTKIDYTYVESAGYVELIIPYHYDASGGMNDVWYAEGGEKGIAVLLDEGREEVRLADFGHLDLTPGGKMPEMSVVDTHGSHLTQDQEGLNAGGGIREMRVRWYFSDYYAGKTLQVKMYVYADKNNDTRPSVQTEYAYPAYTIRGVTGMGEGTQGFAALNKQRVTFSSTSDLPAGTQYQFSTNGWQTFASGGKGTFSYDYDRSPNGRTATFSIRKKYSDYCTQEAKKTVTLRGYQTVNSFSAQYDPSGKVRLSWTLEAGTGEREGGDQFVIERADNSSFNNVKEVGRVSVNIDQTAAFTYEDDLVPDFVQGDVFYRITRSKTLDTEGWGWNFGMTTSVSGVVLEHQRVLSVKAELSENESGRDVAVLTWTHNGTDKIWSSGSSFVIVRNNSTLGSSEQLSGLDQSVFAAGTYTDEAILSCNNYTYDLYVQPGNSGFQTFRLTTGAVLPTDIGEFSGSMEASKGYFSDRVELSWATEGLFDEFSVRRRPYGSGEPFRQVATVAGSGSNNYYGVEDRTCVPGQVYEYQIVGMVNCSGTPLETENPVSDIGFRTPTGDIYGRVTYESGQAVEGVSVQAEPSESGVLPGKSYAFDAGDVLTVDDVSLLSGGTDSLTVQAWVSVDAGGQVLGKEGMFALSVTGGKAVFTAGGQSVASASDWSGYQQSARFVHLTGMMTADTLYICINGQVEGRAARTAPGVLAGNDRPLAIGGGTFAGHIDEVRVWSRAFDAGTLAQDYTRYLTGGETGLEAYYTFDYSVDDRFFDTSYTGTDYHARHGQVSGATLTASVIPTSSQLAYKGLTGADGAYSIRAIPYLGNGTSYMIVPSLGIHSFEPEREVRFINADAQSHTVNFTDKSSFDVSGTVTYRGGTIPVEGVSFYVDGVVVMDDKANVVTTDAQGNFTISVPVGVHEVRAVKQYHTFENEGKITNSDGTDRNYQDRVTGIELTDITTVRYIGRVAGGAVQEAFPVGHSLSTNNLGDGLAVTLTYQNDAYVLANEPRTETLAHFDGKHANEVAFSQNVITIYPDKETGEFVADVLPERFRVNVAVAGHDDMPGDGGELNLTNAFIEETSVYDYEVMLPDSTTEAHSDTVRYHMMQQFIKRYPPTVGVTQLDDAGQPLPYFGDSTYAVNTADASRSYSVRLYDDGGGYAFGMPVFEQLAQKRFGVSVYEEYIYKDEEGNDKDGVQPDRVPTTDARVTFGGDLPFGDQAELEVDSAGYVEYTFQVNDPELTAAVRSISATMVYGDADNPTSIPWDGFDAVVLGAHLRGTDFITAGPDQILFVLRDPPGSNSYAYLEKGVTVDKTSAYVGNVSNTLSEVLSTKAGATVITFAGLGGGTIISSEVENEIGAGVTNAQTIGGSDTKHWLTETTTRFQTSAAPAYVGADGDLYVGYSTNTSFGVTDNVVFVPRATYDANPGDYAVYTGITPVEPGAEWLLVHSTGMGISQNFATLFAYPQVHIEQRLIPQIEEFRNNLLHQPSEGLDFQALANQQNSAVYVSKLLPDDPNYGKSNSDDAFTHADNEDVFDGQSYKIYFPEGTENKTDTILLLNQSIDNWVKHIRENEADKVNAELLQNYSLQAGASVEYAESYTYSFTSEVSFSIVVGAEIAAKTGMLINSNSGVIFDVTENLVTEHGGVFTTEQEAAQAKGFVLEETGTDYLSVDVCRPAGYLADDQYITYEDMMDNPPLSTFIFKTKGGATSCPYEAGYATKYYEPGAVIDEPTVQVEVPEISVEDDFIENVPSGQPAYLTLYIRNNSESQDDNWFNLRMVESSNPDGAGLVMDASPIGNGRALLVPAGETLVKTLEVRKGAVMNYDNLQLTLESQCQCDPTDYVADIVDTVTFSVHFTPSATPVNLREPGDNWTYNTQLPTDPVNGIDKHYMEVVLDGFDVNYDNFHRIMLQYKPTSASESGWTTLMSYYDDEAAYDQAVANGQNAGLIDAADGGTVTYKWFLDDLQDQRYDLRAVGTSMINNEEIQNLSEVHSGIKDMYTPRLFGSAQPANGILTVADEVRLNFNEPIADGYLTQNNFSVTGIRNGAQTDHSVAVRLDGADDYLATEFSRNWTGKDLTAEMWILPDAPQDAVLFSHGNVNEALELRLLADNRLQVQVGAQTVTSAQAVPYEQGTWAYVALVLDHGQGLLTVYYNDAAYVDAAEVGAYSGEGCYRFGASVNGGGHFAGQMHNARLWDKVVPWARLQADRLTLLSGAESNLYAYYPMDEGEGTVLYDKARGANMEMNGCEWALPEGRAVAFNGQNQYLRLSTGSSAIDSSMDYTLEFWFKGEAGQSDATLVSNGRGDGQDMSAADDPAPSLNLLAIGFEAGVLTIHNNGAKVQVDGDWLDNDWHHFALAVSRTTGRGQVMLDGQMRTYFESQDFGGVSAAYLHLGARAWYAPGDAQTLHVDNFFRGELDDFRLWELYKSETLVDDNNNTRLDGTEKGLLAYYPFEYYEDWQGTPELHYTLADQRVQADGGAAVPDAEEVGGTLETAATAPVKDKGPEVDLTYDFVVNDDALIITLTEPVDRIENTTVTFTVDGVRDLNGNEMVSPVTWSAYIDRNQLQWDETRVAVEKAVYEPGDFTVRALNLGGSVQHFTLENVPAWLDASPASGTIDPAGYVDVAFSINEGLNVGTYNEVIYLRGDNNVLEALELDLTVRGEEPDWAVDPADYRYSMSVIGQIRINNIFSSDAGDKLAAFAGGRCVGVSNCTYDRTHDLWYVFLTVYGNDKQAAADGLQFRIWDASTGKVYGATPDEPVAFRNDAIYGSDAPVMFDGRELFFQNINLAAGWNWISFNLANADLADVNATLANGQWTADDVVKSEEYFDSYSAAQGRWTGLLSANGGFGNTSLYQLRSSSAQVLSVGGTAISPDTVPIAVRGGRWNYIGYLPDANYTVTEALAGYEAREGDIIKSQGSFAVYSDNGWIGNLTYLEANRGYMLYRNAGQGDDVQFTYPATQGTLGSRTKRTAASDATYVNTAYAGNMGIVAAVRGAEDADRIVARVDGELRGVAAFVPGGASGWHFLTVAGDEADRTVTFELERGGEVVARASRQAVFHRDAVLGSLDEPYVIDFRGAAVQADVYPSPFTDRLHVQVNVPADGIRVSITVYGMMGQAVARHTDTAQAGLYRWQWDGCTAAGASCPAGTYLVRIDLGGDTFTHKVEKK